MKIPYVQRPYGSLGKLRFPQPRDNVDIGSNSSEPASHGRLSPLFSL